MNYLGFKKELFKLGCFNIHQVYTWQPDFDKNNLTRWLKKGLLIKLRNGFYSFPEYKDEPGFAYLVANRMYRPSYISLHSALSFYGIIPESVIQITSVTSLKTISINNSFGEFSYKSVRENIMFGYDLKPLSKTGSVFFAQPEKAVLDLLYLYPFYNSVREIEELRLDEDYLHHELKKDVFLNYAEKFNSKALKKRVKILINLFNL